MERNLNLGTAPSKAANKHLTLVAHGVDRARETEWDEFYYGVFVTEALEKDFLSKDDIVVGIAAEDNYDLRLTDWRFLQLAVELHNGMVLHDNIVEVLNR